MALQYIIPGASASGENLDFGAIGTTCSVAYSNILLNVSGPFVTSFSVSMTRAADGKGGSSLDVKYSRKYIVVNGTTVLDSGDQTVNFSSAEYPGGILSIAIFSRVEVSGTFGNYKSSAQVGETTYFFNVINLPTDFVFSTVPAIGASYKVALLQNPTLCTGRTLFIKDAIGQAGSTQNIMIVVPTISTVDFTPGPYYINQNNGCVTLMSSGTSNWIIGNSYITNNQPRLPTANVPSKTPVIETLTLNTITFVASDSHGPGDTLLYLPPLTGVPGMAVVVYYGGSTYPRGGGNALVFASVNYITNPIDRLYNSTLPYIVCDAPIKSTGAYFITDGNTWYIAGWAPTPGWNWSDTEGGYWSMNATPGSNRDLDIIAPATNRFYTLPLTVPNSQYMLVLKSSTVSGSGIRFYTATHPNVAVNKFNFLSDGIIWTGNQSNNCYWLVTFNQGSNLLYFPIMLYTP